METTEKELSQEESLRIIHNMITAAKSDVKADAFIFLLWGWLVFIASLAQFTMVLLESPYNSVPWLLMPVGGVVTAIYSIRKRKQQRSKTHVSEYMKYIWTAFTAALLIIMFFNSMSYTQVIACFIILYGMGLFLSGGALQFRPLIFGGIFCWICAIAAFYIQNVYELLILAAAVLGGYIIPGYLLKFNNRKA